MPRDSAFAMTALLPPSAVDHAPALAEADAREALALAVAAQDHLVAVLEEPPRLAAGQRERLGAAPGPLEQAARAAPSRAPTPCRSRAGPRAAGCSRSRRGARPSGRGSSTGRAGCCGSP